MLAHRDIVELLGDRAAQRGLERLAEAASATWRRAAGLDAIEAELGRFAKGEALDRLPVLARLCAGGPAAADLVAQLIGVFLPALAEVPLSLNPVPHFRGQGMKTLELAGAGGATLALHALEGSSQDQVAETLCLSPIETRDCVIAGRGVVELARLRPGSAATAGFERRSRRLRPGVVIDRDGRIEAPVRYRVRGTLVLLRLQRRLEGEVRAFRLEDGVLVRQAAGTLRESRLALAVTLLGRFGRRDAAAEMAAMVGEAEPAALRWQALCACLALDTATGWGALKQVLARGEDPLAKPATALRARLVAAHPALAQAA